MARAQGPPCSMCGRPTPLPSKTHDRRFRERHREKRLKYARWYYENVTKPKRLAALAEAPEH